MWENLSRNKGFETETYEVRTDEKAAKKTPNYINSQLKMGYANSFRLSRQLWIFNKQNIHDNRWVPITHCCFATYSNVIEFANSGN
ncbi:MAG: hypothetical protein ACI9IT_002597 [Glaciecola sp.]|jgi:hypothetical protein